jgi:hypothetical protein
MEGLFQKLCPMRVFIIALTFLLGTWGCRPSEIVSPDSLTGVWVEASARQDTLIFNLDRFGKSLPKTILVNRGKEINAGGYLVPKLGSGYYGYEIQDNKILVVSMLSSSLQRTAYKIEQSESQLRVENFYELGFNQPATAMRTLVRL